MRLWPLILMLSLALGRPGMSVAARELFDSPKPAHPSPGRMEKRGLSVDVQALDAEHTRDIFETDLVAKGAQPLLIKIRNESGQTYRFRKADVDARYLPAAEAAKLSYENPVVIGGQALGRAIGFIPGLIFKAPRKVPPRPILNRGVQESFVREEIADADIEPGGSLEGFMFVRPFSGGRRLRVTLINVQTQEPLVFDVPTG